MKNKILLSILIMLIMISCNRINSRGTADTSVYSNESSVITNEPEKKGIINADCNWYDKYGNEGGRLIKGESITILNGYFDNNFIDNDQYLYMDVAIEVKLPSNSVSIWVQERYIDYSDNEELFTAWFKNKLLVAEYYYTGTPEDIFYNDWWGLYYILEDGKYREERLTTIRHFYSEDNENRLRISGKYFIVRHGNGMVTAYRLESVVKDRNIYTLNLSDDGIGEIKVTLVDNGDGVTMTHYTITGSVFEGPFIMSGIKKMLNIKYVPYDKEKSEKTENAVSVWSNEQLKILNSEYAKW
ncbi:MAG: hypothetical protein LBC76_01390 [Treponema sp.]|jgi:hypothetical protein|nr:hypothetical protein [Treponema sp.]